MRSRYNFARVAAILIALQSVPLNAMAITSDSNVMESGFSAPMYAKLDTSTGKEVASEPAVDASTDDESDSAMLNASVEKKGYAPKPPAERVDSVVGTASVVSNKDKKKRVKSEAEMKALREAANKVGPTELQASGKEVREKVVTIRDAEKAQLADIWDAALCRSQDIQFVVQKLMPTKDPKHSTAVMMKMLSTAMYGSVAAGGMMTGVFGGGTSGAMIQSAGSSLIMNVLNQVNANTKKKLVGTETEVIMLYKMIRDVGREVSQDFFRYKKDVHQVTRACTDFEDLQNMVSEARKGQDSATQLQMEFLLRKCRREIDALNDDTRNARDALVTLAGADAVNNLDQQISDESEKLGQPVMTKDEAH